MNAENNLPELVTAWAGAWTGTDPNALAALFTPDATYTDQAIGVTMTGREQIAGWKARTDAVMDGVGITISGAHRDDCRIRVEGVYSGHLKGAPTPFAVPIVTLLDVSGDQISGDQITADRDFYDLADVLAQSGLPADWKPADA
jgi:limonene-1,2-epoxide hydrolase